jgi:ribonuclease D
VQSVSPGGIPEFRFLTREDEARSELARFAQEAVVSLDTETFYDPPTKCWKHGLTQVAAASGPVLLIDALSVPADVLRPLVEAPTPLLAAHNARYDEGVLQEVGLRPQGFVDTLKLAQDALWLPSYGLLGVVQELFGVSLDKSLQKSAWGRRPLSPEQLAYAAADAYWTLRAYHVLRERLQAAGHWERANKRASLVPRERDLLGEKHVPGTKKRKAAPPLPTEPLTEAQAALVQRLKGWRMEQAKRDRLPAYMVCHDRTLELIARAHPTSTEALLAVHGLGEAKVKRFGSTLLAALGAPAGSEAPAAPPPEPPQQQVSEAAPEEGPGERLERTPEDEGASLGPLFSPR